MPGKRTAFVFFLFAVACIAIAALVRYVLAPRYADRLPRQSNDPPVIADPPGTHTDTDSLFMLHFIDTQPGQTIFLQSAQKNMMIDAGNRDSNLLAYLRDLDIDTLHLLVVTHPHADRIDGLNEILTYVPVMEIIDLGLKDPPTLPVNINTASIEELLNIIHIGPARAREIIEQRPFSSVDELLRISGIDNQRLNDIKQQNLAFTD